MKIVVVRNDRLGDFMLAWPTFALLKQYWPTATIVALVPPYTSEIASLCPWIDEVMIDQGEGAIALARKLHASGCNALLTLYSTRRVAQAGWLARIPYRLAPATKLAQFFYNRRLIQRRSSSAKPEYAYNLDLVWQFLLDHGVITAAHSSEEHSGDWLSPDISRPLMCFNDNVAELKQQFCATYQLDRTLPLLFIHPGSGGSATNLRATQYAQLANCIAHSTNVNFVITAGPGEHPIAAEVAGKIAAPVIVYDSSNGLAEFARILQLADLFISGSTGPLHIAGALDVPTAAFYPRHRSATPLRWQTLNSPQRRVAFIPPHDAVKYDVSSIDLDNAAQTILSRYLHHLSNTSSQVSQQL